MRRIPVWEVAFSFLALMAIAARGGFEPGSDEKPLKYWIEQLKSTDPQKRFAAVRELETRTVLEAAKRKHPERPNTGSFQSEEIPVLVSALANSLQDPDPVVRRELASALADLGPKAKAALPALIARLNDENASVRRTTAWALGEIRSELNDVVPALQQALADRDSAVRWTAAFSLGTIGPGVKSAAAELQKTIEDPQASVRVAARMAVWRLTGAEKMLRRAVEEAAEVNDSVLLLNAFTWLSSIGAPAVPVLRENLKHREARNRYLAAYALAESRPPAKEAASDLIVALEDSDAMVRTNAAYALGEIRAKSAVPALIKALKDSDRDVRQSAGEALKILDPEAAKKASIK